MKTGTEVAMKVDIRRQRATALVHAILQEIREPIDEVRHDPDFNAEREIYGKLMALLTQEGAEVLTDWHRTEYGLPPRGPDGWTAEELHVLERARMEAMLRPISMVLETPKDR